MVWHKYFKAKIVSNFKNKNCTHFWSIFRPEEATREGELSRINAQPTFPYQLDLLGELIGVYSSIWYQPNADQNPSRRPPPPFVARHAPAAARAALAAGRLLPLRPAAGLR